MTPLNSVNTSPERSSEKSSILIFKNEIKQLGASVALTAALLAGTPNPAQAQATEKKPIQTEQVEKLETSDYITQAPAKLKQYYPEEEAYFQKIFEVMKNAWPGIANIANLKLEEQFNEYAEDFTNEKDRWTAVFMFCELAYPATEFTKRKEKLDEFDLDMRQVVATEALREMTLHFAKTEKKANEIKTKAKEDIKKTKKEWEELDKKWEELGKKWEEVDKKLKELEKLWKRINQQREQAIQGTERVMEEIDPQTVKTVVQVQEMVRYYEKICKENGKKPTQKAQELINQLPEKQKKK